MLRSMCGVVLLMVLVPKPGVGAEQASHTSVSEIRVAGAEGCALQTIALLPEGRVAALVARGRYAQPEPGAAPVSHIRIYDAAGAEAAAWTVDFTAQSLAVGPEGTLLVGGDGRIVKFGTDGEVLATLELPHLQTLTADKEGLRQRAEEQRKQQEESIADIVSQFAEQRTQLEETLAELNEKDEADLTAADKRRMARFKQQLEELDSISEQFRVPSVEEVIQQTMQRLRAINTISVSGQDVYVVTGESAGYGYAVWRLDHELQDSTKVLSELRGCCGQMDVFANGDELFVAENTSHRVGRYSRDGELLGTIGQRLAPQPRLQVKAVVKLKTRVASENEAEEAPAEGEEAPEAEAEVGFGGCCNPMNVCVGRDGLVYTAESEGIIRCFKDNGDYIGLVARAELTGGCKNVEIAVSPDANRVYFCDLPGQRILILSREEPSSETARN